MSFTIFQYAFFIITSIFFFNNYHFWYVVDDTVRRRIRFHDLQWQLGGDKSGVPYMHLFYKCPPFAWHVTCSGIWRLFPLGASALQIIQEQTGRCYCSSKRKTVYQWMVHCFPSLQWISNNAQKVPPEMQWRNVA